jgi:hypothetical protein
LEVAKRGSDKLEGIEWSGDECGLWRMTGAAWGTTQCCDLLTGYLCVMEHKGPLWMDIALGQAA